jgi:hypothetical protein
LYGKSKLRDTRDNKAPLALDFVSNGFFNGRYAAAGFFS